jgi:hypothetical protein
LRQKIFGLYDGYSWDGKTRVLNPWSVLSCFYYGQLDNFWFQSGSPTFLVDLIARRQMNFEVFKSDQAISQNINVMTLSTDINDKDKIFDDFDPATLMFQTGYLTVRTDVEHPRSKFYLGFPNLEVRASLTPLLMNLDRKFLFEEPLAQQKMAKEILAALFNRDADRFSSSFAAFLNTFPFSLHNTNKAYYRSLFASAIIMAGQYIELEPSSGEGRADAIIGREATGEVFVVEIKYRNDSSELSAAIKAAKKQIEEKKYALSFQWAASKIYKTALAISGNTEVKIEFEEALNWRLKLLKGRYVIKNTKDDSEEGEPSA